MKFAQYVPKYNWPVPKTYSVAHARAHLPEILDEVEAGKGVALSRGGRLVAVLLSSEEYNRLRGSRTSFGDAYGAFVERHDLTAMRVDDVESPRDVRPGRKVQWSRPR